MSEQPSDAVSGERLLCPDRSPHRSRWAWAEVDLDAIAHNVGVLRNAAAPAEVWAVVKADGYGHGAVAVAQAALAGGASGLCVALVSEGVALRAGGIDAPVLLLSEQPPELAAEIVAQGLIATVSTRAGIDALAAAGSAADGTQPVHLKIDTGMHRVGAAPSDAVSLHAAVTDHPQLTLAGLFTHLAVADEPNRTETVDQLRRFDDVVDRLPPVERVHAANSAATLAHPRARYTMVRPGIAVYGISPGAALDHVSSALRPAMTLKSRVSFIKRLRAGDRLSYGLRHTFTRDANVATVPIGYADGVRRTLSGTGTAVLIGGRRREVVGTITMDQLMADCRDDDVAIGDEVVLIGRQGDEQVRAEDWARTLGTIGYEIVCGISARVPRRYTPVHPAGST